MNIESNKPLYLQVEADIRNSILQKNFVPTKSYLLKMNLVNNNNVSKITIRKAMSNLGKRGNDSKSTRQRNFYQL